MLGAAAGAAAEAPPALLLGTGIPLGLVLKTVANKKIE
jgi:hypothetical protein